MPPLSVPAYNELGAVEVVGNNPVAADPEGTSISFIQAAPGVDIFEGEVKKDSKSDTLALSLDSQSEEYLTGTNSIDSSEVQKGSVDLSSESS